MKRQDTVQAFRERLDEVIERSGVSRAAFAKRLGIDRSTLAQILSPANNRLPRAETLAAIAADQQISIDWLLGLSQEGKAAAAVAALQKMMIVKARVRRDGELKEVPAEELVPGDVVSFEAGDLISADGRIIAAATLEIDEAALTGESVPTAKEVAPVAEDAPLGDRHDMAYMNTNVTRGSGQFVVTATDAAGNESAATDVPSITSTRRP